MNDLDLLQDYARSGSQSAFTRLVERHLPLVWSTARRQVGDAHLAEDIAQQVFSLLAQKAANLSAEVILSGWLYRTTTHLAARALRGEQRRVNREQEAVLAMNDQHADSIWPRIEPHLDAAMSALDERDRDAIVLRYFENKSLKEVGAALGTNDDAAQKRLSRAVEKLRQSFAQHGQTVTTGSLIAAMGTGAIQPAPAALLALVSASTLTVVPVATTTLNLLSWTMLKPALAAVAVIALASTAVIQRNANQSLRAERDTALVNLQHERDNATAAPPAVVKPAMDDKELLRLRAEVSRLRGTEAELARLKNEIASLHEALARAQTPPAPVPAPVESDQAAAQKTRMINNLKQVGLGLRLLANEKTPSVYLIDGSPSPELTSALGSGVMKLLENVTLLVTDSKTLAIMGRETSSSVVAYSTNPTQLPDGRWSRIYLRASGSVKERQHNTAEEIWDGTAP